MSGGNYLAYQGSGRATDRDSYHDRRYDTNPRNFRGRGSFRGRKHEHYRGRGNLRGRDYRDYNDSRERDPRERDPRDRDPRDREPRDRDLREGPNREYEREREREEFRPRERDDSDARADRMDSAEAQERPGGERLREGLQREAFERERLERERLDRDKLRAARGGYRGSQGFRNGNNHEQSSGGSTPGGKSTATKNSNPWLSILHIGEGKTAARMEANYRELQKVNQAISELQADAHRMECLLAVLEVYGARDALNVEITSEKLDEFSYL